jgi:hypothetical protein
VAKLRKRETKRTAAGDRWFNRIENAINSFGMEKKSAEQASCVIW